MSFSKSIPDEVLTNPNTAKFVGLLDALQESKQEVIAAAMRSHNPILCNDKRWLIKYLDDVGFPDIPEYLPIVCLQQLALNMDIIYRMRGTLEGIELLCGAIVLGEAIVDMSQFVRPSCKLLLLDSKYDWMPTDNSDPDTHRFLTDTNVFNQPSSLTITIYSKVFTLSDFNQTHFRQWLTSLILNYLTFQHDCIVTLNFNGRDEYVYPQDFNNFFKNE